MSISTTVGGITKEITPSATIGGVVYEFDTIHANEGGVLYEIFSNDSSLPTSLTWSVNKTILSYDTKSKIISTSDDGLTISYVSNTGEKQSCICSNTFTLRAGEAVIMTPISISGEGSTADTMDITLRDSNNSIAASGNASNDTTSTNYMKIATLKAPADGEYYIRLGGHSISGSQSGIYYYTSTVTCEIAFTQP